MLLEKPGIKLSAGLFDILSSYYRIIGAVSGKKIEHSLEAFLLYIPEYTLAASYIY